MTRPLKPASLQLGEHFALTNARLFDGTGAPARDGVTVVVRSDLIESVATGPAPSGLPSLDVAGLTLIPGLIDLHVHLTSQGDLPLELLPYGLAAAGRNLLRAGFTTVRDVGSATINAVFDLRSAIATGLCPGPRVLASGQILSAPSPGSEMFGEMYRETQGVEDFQLGVRQQVGRGADHIKVMATGALTVAGEEVEPAQLSDPEMQALVEEARLHGVPVAAHAEGAAGVRLAAAHGVTTIEHGDLGYQVPDALAMMAAKGIILVPTLSVFPAVYDDEVRWPVWLRDRARQLGDAAHLTLEAARSEGVRIGVGADAGPQGTNAKEMLRLAEAGLSTAEVLVGATSTGAAGCRLSEQLGTIEPGKIADLCLIEGDPLADISLMANLDAIVLVFQAGHAVSGAWLDQEPSDHNAHNQTAEG